MHSWAEALGRLTGLSGYDLKRYLFARAVIPQRAPIGSIAR